MSAPLFDADRYRQALRFAAEAHADQKVTGTGLPYLTHVVAVTAEVIAALSVERWPRGELAVLCALLHDTVEDTDRTVDDIARVFGDDVAAGVSALSKDATLTRHEAMRDSLARIAVQPAEVGAVKLADRIVNLDTPPEHWSAAKIAAYREEAVLIAETLGGASAMLHARLRQKIAEYPPGR